MDAAVSRVLELLAEVEEFAHIEIEVRTKRILALRQMPKDLEAHEQALAEAERKLGKAAPEERAWLIVEVKLLRGLISEQQKTIAQAQTLDGKAYTGLDYPIGLLRAEAKELALPATEMVNYRRSFETWQGTQYIRALGELQQAMYVCNKLLTRFLDTLEGWPGGIALRSPYLGQPQVAQEWLARTNHEMAELIKVVKHLRDTHDTDRPVSGKA